MTGQQTRHNPLADSRLDVTITDLVAEYELVHTFRNQGHTAMEAVYSFPLPLEAAFLGMDARLAGSRRVARVQPHAEATHAYDEAVADGDSAVLLEQLQPGLMCVNLGNLQPGEDGEITLRFAAPLACAGGAARFVLPLVQRPRYGRSRLDELAEPEPDFAAEHPLTAAIRVRGLLARAPVTCASHPARFARDANDQTMLLDGAMLDRDLVLAFELPAAFTGQARLIDDGDAALAMLSFNLPPAPDAAGPCDLCLIMDGSGSMSGDAIRQSRAALVAVADALGDHDRIQVLRFGSRVIPLFRRPLRAGARVRAATQQLADTLDADLGGTEMGAALEAALDGSPPADDTRPRQRAIILVTDGAVPPGQLAEARERARQRGVRVFVVAVGSSAGSQVLAPLAADTGATLERAVPAEPIDAAVLRQLARARAGEPQPIDIDWGHAAAQPLPQAPAYPGDAVTAIATLPAGAALQARVYLADGTEQSLGATVTQPAPALRALAGQRIWRHADADDKQAVALRYGLISDHTSAVLVRVRADADKAEGLPAVTPVRSMTPHGTLGGRGNFSLPDGAYVASTATDYATEPMFARRVSSAPPAKPPRPSLGKRAAGLFRGHRKAPPAQVPGVALRRALIALLLDQASTEITLRRILDRLPPDQRDAARDFIEARCPDGIDLAAATALLRELLDEATDSTLDDDQEARLALLAHAVTADPVTSCVRR